MVHGKLKIIVKEELGIVHKLINDIVVWLVKGTLVVSEELSNSVFELVEPVFLGSLGSSLIKSFVIHELSVSLLLSTKDASESTVH